jgi:glycosyltransferase involved in cell wall biosynthesis
MYYGCSAIASDIAPHCELFESSGCGILFKQGDAADLAKHMEFLLTDPQARKRLGLAARKFVFEQGMTKTAMIEKHASLYQKFARK